MLKTLIVQSPIHFNFPYLFFTFNTHQAITCPKSSDDSSLRSHDYSLDFGGAVYLNYSEEGLLGFS